MPRPGGVDTQRNELRQLLVDDIRNETRRRQGLNGNMKIECVLNQSGRILFFGFKFLPPVRSEFPHGVVYVFPVVRAVHYFDVILQAAFPLRLVLCAFSCVICVRPVLVSERIAPRAVLSQEMVAFQLNVFKSNVIFPHLEIRKIFKCLSVVNVLKKIGGLVFKFHSVIR